MANEIVLQFAVLSVLAVTLLYLTSVLMKRKTRRARPHDVVKVQLAAEMGEKEELKAEPQSPQTITIELKSEPVPLSREQTGNGSDQIDSGASLPETAVIPAVVPSAVSAARRAVSADAAAPVIPEIVSDQNPNQRILAGISENIRRSLIKPVPTYSPLQYPEKPRDTEYVRVKKKIITPHGQIRFSILKDSLSANMLAVFRRACLEWKSPNDLISFLPPYLEPEAEILNGRLLLIGTPGHDEKLAIPIRSIEGDAGLYDCFDIVTDARSATNTPAVVLTHDDAFKVVSRGVITQPVFVESVERIHAAG